MQTFESSPPAGSKPKPLSSRIFVRCYRHYGEAKRAYDALRVVAGIPEKRMTVVARGLEWREPLPTDIPDEAHFRRGSHDSAASSVSCCGCSASPRPRRAG